ncbi:hypothetical protein [Xenorhabdus bovienii]|uniref:hypothetical protein n=1 Tax=Xenorhabdus bovienii TaxID=40576 RepID=UPI00237C6D44|nr:hypothetical protein [Xenorhabdus bovienii]MDE1481093.1 hypothetical protein [Xenorhabdus bovienii]MDE9430927.1 hypothetical protein [Xenorhabdus bovienii]MDE9440364.1 hypothetical protein [Xenorhabdus bovienii]MDE9456291.1 hypothetical protein [Xenorhabdus bovienii]MDE9484524.1 hypothetical protein [Xenorhabdus bovienii]
MKKELKIIFYIIPILFIVGILSIFLIIITANENYTEDNYIKYLIYTTDEIKNSPRISNNYIIMYRSMDGNSPQINEITYINTQNKKKIEEYVKSISYIFIEKNNFGEKWQISSDHYRTIYITENPDEKKITLSVEYSQY